MSSYQPIQIVPAAAVDLWAQSTCVFLPISCFW